MASGLQNQRYDELREREFGGVLTDAERAELAAIHRSLDERESSSLATSEQREAEEIAAGEAAIAQLEQQNRMLRDYLSERQAFLERARALAKELQAEDQRMRQQFARVLDLLHEPTASSHD
jgi:hypothetical protein